jgi:hypothetical protein
MATFPSPYSYLKAQTGSKTPPAQKAQSVENGKRSSTQRTVTAATTFTVT